MTESDMRRAARENLRGNWGISVGVTLVAALLGGMAMDITGGDTFRYILNYASNGRGELPALLRTILVPVLSGVGIWGLLTFLVGGTVALGHAEFLLRQYRGEPLTFDVLFSQFDRFGTGFAQSFLRTLYVILWSLLLVIPGVVKSYSYAMTPFILAEHPEMTASAAIDASKTMMDGHKMDLFLLQLTFIGWELLSGLTLGIGHLPGFLLRLLLSGCGSVRTKADIAGRIGARDCTPHVCSHGARVISFSGECVIPQPVSASSTPRALWRSICCPRAPWLSAFAPPAPASAVC